ncbi:flagellar motor switch protein FliN [Nocardioides flavescens]
MTAAPLDPQTHQDRAIAAGEAAAGSLPASEVLTAGGVAPGDPSIAELFGAAVVADLGGGLQGNVAVLVDEELVRAIAESPIEGLSLVDAVQPALDAAASALGGSAQVGRELLAGEAPDLLGMPFTTVTLVGQTLTAALLISDAALPVPAAAPGQPAAPAGQPTGQGATPLAAAPEPAAVAAPVPPLPSPSAAVARPAGPSRGIEMLHGVDMEVTVELGRTRMTVRELLSLSPGQVLELDRAAGSPADLLVNGRLIARGEVVVVDEDFGLRVTEIVDESAER